MPNQKSKKFIRVSELSELISMPKYTIRKLVREGIFPAYRITGKDYLLDFDEIVKVIQSNKV